MCANKWQNKLFHFTYPFRIKTCGKGLEKTWISQEQKELFSGYKKHSS